MLCLNSRSGLELKQARQAKVQVYYYHDTGTVQESSKSGHTGNTLPLAPTVPLTPKRVNVCLAADILPVLSPGSKDTKNSITNCIEFDCI